MLELTNDEVRARLSVAIRDAGSQKAFARVAGVSPAYVNDVLRGRREIGERVLAALDVQRVERFVSLGRHP